MNYASPVGANSYTVLRGRVAQLGVAGAADKLPARGCGVPAADDAEL